MHGNPERGYLQVGLPLRCGGSRGADNTDEVTRAVQMANTDQRDADGQDRAGNAEGSAEAEVCPVGKVQVVGREFVAQHAQRKQVDGEWQHQSDAATVRLH